ncbi:MAG TPA: stage II sporulation protein D [Ruminococcaceae bacterium]|nr:stage II sporulation protein D [Oscillospiraceae bacterium]
MKNFYLVLIIFMIVCLLVIPITAVGERPQDALESLPSSAPADVSDIQSGESMAETDFIVYLTEEDKTAELSAQEYLFGVIACEIPPDYPDEAIKAQAVAAYTSACYQKKRQRGNPSEELKGADLSDNPSTHQGYITKEQAKEKWGEKYEEHAARITALIESVKNKALVYEGGIINAAYYAISSGKTESAAAVWGTEVPYLQPVESVGDLLAPGYLTTVSYTLDEFKEKAAALDITLEGEDPAAFLSDPERSESGMVVSYTLGGQTVTGQQMRSAYSLRSANFDLAYVEDAFTFTVRGYGHDVGMSQFGAKTMAEQGSSYEDILKWYYIGCEIEDYDVNAE